ncbi:Aryl-alcohol oxidase [Trametes cinnabarina]|uniref:Aryl-alcohol oxidase n=1 Tax=Pycnoporus cinnabarinus TaxID=5643 RepID=A0A060SUP1_PYCCI|nr:Aryl-alcohol oxidase [Trametes cinnabarina]
MRCFTSKIARITLVALVVSTQTAHGALYSDVSQLPKLKYDFVVIGAGAAGNVIAARLTENPKFSVLLIEAGISDQGVLGVQVPFLAPTNLPNSSVTWNYTTVPQTSLNNRVLAYSRGHLMTYTRGSDDEYNRWAELTGDDSWAWRNLEPFYLKSTRLVPPVDHHSTKGLVDPAVHGFGPVEVSLPGLPSELDGRVVNTSKASGAEFPFNVDIQSGNSVGVGIAQSTIGGGIRSSSSRAYLEPNLNRSNLHVLLENSVTRLVQSGSDHGVPVFKQVELAASPSGKRAHPTFIGRLFMSVVVATRTIVTADKEVILSAGSIGTPQILMLSGLGDAAELGRLGIRPVVNLPDVGKNLQDHPIMSNYWVVNSNNTFDDVLRNTSILDADLAQWTANKTGLFGNAPANAVALLRIPGNASIFEHPFTFPLIDPNFFNTTFDQFAMLSAVKAARAFMTAPPWQGFVASRFGPVGSAETDEDIIAAARDAIVTIWHPTSTARMSPRHASWGVVDPQLLVKGVSGLRIVDASIMPIIPAAHTTGPTYILAERAAEFIKEAWC